MSVALNVLRATAPLIVGFAFGAIFPMKKTDGANIPARPPAYVFGIAWLILYILIGIAWVFAAQINPLFDVGFILLVALLALWIYVYSGRANPRGALYILLTALLATLLLAFALSSVGSAWGLCLVPLAVWLIFAGMMNYTIVNEIK